MGAIVLAAFVEVIEAPTAVGPLMDRQPMQGPLDGLFALGRAAAIADARAAARRIATIEFLLHDAIDRLQQVGRKLRAIGHTQGGIVAGRFNRRMGFPARRRRGRIGGQSRWIQLRRRAAACISSSLRFDI